MQKISKSFLLSIFIKLLLLLTIAKSLSLGLWWLLPNDGVEFEEQKSYKPAYQRVDFKNMLSSPSKLKKKQTKISSSITKMMLKGLYGKGSKGMAIVALKSSPKKTTILSVSEVYLGYTLKTILKSGVIFRKNSKDYTLSIEKQKATSKTILQGKK